MRGKKELCGTVHSEKKRHFHITELVQAGHTYRSLVLHYGFFLFWSSGEMETNYSIKVLSRCPLRNAEKRRSFSFYTSVNVCRGSCLWDV